MLFGSLCDQPADRVDSTNMRFHGYLGYEGPSVEDPPDSGIYKASVVERVHTGVIVKHRRNQDNATSINGVMSVNNDISIVGDPYALEHLHNLKYIRWNNVCWTVTSVETDTPRIIVSIGEVYNGAKA